MRTQNPLTTLDETVFVTNLVADLDDIACVSILEDFEGLGNSGSVTNQSLRRVNEKRTCCTGTLLESNLIRSRALRIAAGS